jgi:putative transposase
MPFRERTRMSLRLELVELHESGLYSVSELAERLEITRATAYKWLGRYRVAGSAGLLDRSRAPRHRPGQMPAWMEAAIVQQRARHPHWGARKLRRVLIERQPQVSWPARSSVHEVLVRNALLSAATRRRALQSVWRVATEHFTASSPNELWTVDFKGQFRLQNARYCYPLTVQDRASRFLLGLRAHADTAGAPVRTCFERLFAECGLPVGIGSDNGLPFAGSGLCRLSRLAVWWMKLGIALYRTRPGCPQHNGAHERMHRTLKDETCCPPAADLRAQQHRFDRFRGEYNGERPHESLGDRTPAQLYGCSNRRLPRRLEQPEYPGHFERRRVSSVGTISWHNRWLFLSEALAGEDVGLEEIADGIWSIYFATTLLARLDARERELIG